MVVVVCCLFQYNTVQNCWRELLVKQTRRSITRIMVAQSSSNPHHSVVKNFLANVCPSLQLQTENLHNDHAW